MKRGSRFLITGGAGLIGSHIVDMLIQEERHFNCKEIVVFDDFTRGRHDNLAWALANGPVTIIEGDIRDNERLTRAMRDIDVVFHQAAIRITRCAEEPRLALEVMADGTFNVLESAVMTGVRKVIAASSASVYGLAETFPTAEEHHPYNNRTLYGATKIFNEGLLRSFHEMYGLDYVGLRYFNVYGPRMDVFGVYTEVLIRWMERIASGQPPVILGAGTQTMDFVYVEDVARANILAAKSEVTDQVFNIASGVETSLNELAHELLDVMGSGMQPEHGPERKVNPVSRRLAGIGKAKRMLGYEPRVHLRDGLVQLVDWWQRETSEKKGVVS
jgi:UDP-glucose 4-epimerase